MGMAGAVCIVGKLSRRFTLFLATIIGRLPEFLFASYAMGYKRLVIVMIECLTIGLGIFSRHRSIKWLSISLCLFLALGFFTINPFLRPY